MSQNYVKLGLFGSYADFNIIYRQSVHLTVVPGYYYFGYYSCLCKKLTTYHTRFALNQRCERNDH